MAALLSLKYSMYLTVERTRQSLYFIWSIGCAMTVVLVICNKFIGRWYVKVEILYITVVFSALFIVVAVVTYAVLFWKFWSSRQLANRPSHSNQDQVNSVSMFQTFLKSRFYVSILIFLTYLLFNTIPYIIYIPFYEDWAADKESDARSVIVILLHLGYTADALIYIFLQRDVYRQLFAFLRCNRITEPHQ